MYLKDSGSYVSEMSSVMGSLKLHPDDTSIHKGILPRTQLSSEFNVDDGGMFV